MVTLLKVINKTDINLISFNSIRSGSVIIDMSVDSTSTLGTQAFSTEYGAISK